jgi:hypothetical protein
MNTSPPTSAIEEKLKDISLSGSIAKEPSHEQESTSPAVS